MKNGKVTKLSSQVAHKSAIMYKVSADLLLCCACHELGAINGLKQCDTYIIYIIFGSQAFQSIITFMSKLNIISVNSL